MNISCSDSKEEINIESNTTNNTMNNTAHDTILEKDSAKENKNNELVDEVINLANTLVENKKIKDSIRDANEPRLWVYQIGDSYDDDKLVAKAYDKYINSETDLYVFKKNRNKYFLIKGNGVASEKILSDSIKTIQSRIHDRISFLDLSKLCKKLPTNTNSIKYKIEKEKKEAICKTCE